MSAVPAPSRTRAGTQAAPVQLRPVRLRRLSTSGLIWMGVLTLLLGGLVALNVAALRSTIAMTTVNTKVQQLQQQNRLDAAEVGRLSSNDRIAQKAASYGMHQRLPGAGRYLDPSTSPGSTTAGAPG